MIGLPGSGSQILQEVVEFRAEPFVGTIIVSDGLIEATTLEPLTSDFVQWLEQGGNNVVGTTTENLAGNNSVQWFDRLSEVAPGVDRTEPYITSHSDCLYAIALALLQGDGVAEPKTVKDNLRTMQTSAYEGVAESDVVDISPDAEGMLAAQEALASGKLIRLDGASGTVVFDEDGDRATQLYKTVVPSVEGGRLTWVKQSTYDGDTAECIQNCP